MNESGAPTGMIEDCISIASLSLLIVTVSICNSAIIGAPLFASLLLLAVGRFVNFMRSLVGKFAASFSFGYLVPPSKGAISI